MLAEARNPFSILTKSTLVLRDLDLLADASRRTDVGVNLSIGTLDDEVWKLTEPGTPPPRRRLEAVRRLNEAGVPCGVLVAPLLPGSLGPPRPDRRGGGRRVDAGAASISSVALHLRPGVSEHYLGWLAGARPDLVDDYRARYRRPYLPANEQSELAARVKSSVARARGEAGPPFGHVARGRAVPVAPTATPSTQLRMEL